MKRYWLWALGVGVALTMHATTAAAQTRVDVGVFTPHVAARVSVGAPRVYVVDRADRFDRGRWVWIPERWPRQRRYVRDYYDPYPYYRDRGYRRDWIRADREYYQVVRKARRGYYKDARKAEREYAKDRRQAARGRW
jgi:hypothetical protein